MQANLLFFLFFLVASPLWLQWFVAWLHDCMMMSHFFEFCLAQLPRDLIALDLLCSGFLGEFKMTACVRFNRRRSLHATATCFSHHCCCCCWTLFLTWSTVKAPLTGQEVNRFRDFSELTWLGGEVAELAKYSNALINGYFYSALLCCLRLCKVTRFCHQPDRQTDRSTEPASTWK